MVLDLVGIAVLVAMGVMVFVVTLEALRFSAFSGKASRAVLAMCTACLSVLGMFRMLTPPQAWNNGNAAAGACELDFVSIPYVALAIAILAVLIARWLLRLFGSRAAREGHGKERSAHAKETYARFPHAGSETARSPDIADRAKRNAGDLKR